MDLDNILIVDESYIDPNLGTEISEMLHSVKMKSGKTNVFEFMGRGTRRLGQNHVMPNMMSILE